MKEGRVKEAGRKEEGMEEERDGRKEINKKHFLSHIKKKKKVSGSVCWQR